MRIALVEGFEIHYQVAVAATSGYARVKTNEVYFHNLLSRELSEMIVPVGAEAAAYEQVAGEGDGEKDEPSWANGPITFKAIGNVDGANAQPGFTLTLGFVQNLTASNRRVDYDGNHWFEETHDGFPIKDGRGDPWYKEPSEKFDQDSKKVEFRLQAADEPRFSYPLTMHGGTAALKIHSIEFQDEYHCCLVAKLVEEQTGFATLHFLHSILWKMDVSLLSALGGITVELDTPISHRPANFTTVGEMVKESHRKAFDGAPAL